MSTTSTTVRPITDPETVQRLRARISEAVRTAPSYIPHTPGGIIGGESSHHDEGRVSRAWFEALRRLARDAGYKVRLRDLSGTNTLGFQTGPLGDADAPAWTLTLDQSMSEASMARTFVHELTHALLAHGGRTPAEARQIFSDRAWRALSTGVHEDTDKEVACELAAYAVMREARIGTSRFSLEYLGPRLRKLSAAQLREAMLAAELAARVIWSAVGPVMS